MLSLVPTPIGNLEDITARALTALKTADAVYCEDTRRTRALMTHFGLAKELVRYDEHDPRCLEKMLERLKDGASIALVSDAGSPAISDPGLSIVSRARQEGLAVTALPGPSALTAALAGSGLPADSFVFLGFLPRSSGKRKKILSQAATLKKTVVVYESPFRVAELLSEAADVFGPDALACAAREISKVYEEWISGSLQDVKGALSRKSEVLGEFVVLFHPAKERANGRHHQA